MHHIYISDVRFWLSETSLSPRGKGEVCVYSILPGVSVWLTLDISICFTYVNLSEIYKNCIMQLQWEKDTKWNTWTDLQRLKDFKMENLFPSIIPWLPFFCLMVLKFLKVFLHYLCFKSDLCCCVFLGCSWFWTRNCTFLVDSIFAC